MFLINTVCWNPFYIASHVDEFNSCQKVALCVISIISITSLGCHHLFVAALDNKLPLYSHVMVTNILLKVYFLIPKLASHKSNIKDLMGVKLRIAQNKINWTTSAIVFKNKSLRKKTKVKENKRDIQAHLLSRIYRNYF